MQPPVAASKKIGGVKQTGGGRKSAASSDATPTRKVGGVKPHVRGWKAQSSQMQSCPENCPGEYKQGMWVHSADCPWVAVLYRAHGNVIEEWRCLFDCDPLEMSVGWTHPYDCEFWNRTEQTPFDTPKRHHDEPINHLASVTLTNKLRNDNEAYRRTFEAFPEALQAEDDDLPF